jgi:hypothetical protein
MSDSNTAAAIVDNGCLYYLPGTHRRGERGVATVAPLDETPKE